MLAPRIVAGKAQPQTAPQTIAFHPENERRVVSTQTAAAMRQMMQAVVLHGTGRKAGLVGYSAAGKTGTAQKFDPVTHKYSHTNFYASFAGFAPINNPAITVVVIFDSPMAPTITQREGGWQGAPVFNRIAQQVLEYLHTPHDTEIPTNKVLLARAKANDKDLEEGSPDHPGDDIDEMQPSGDALADSKPPQNSKHSPVSGPAPSSAIVTAALRQTETLAAPEKAEGLTPTATDAVPSLTTGTVVVDVEQGGIVVPSFLGKSVRSSIEMAQDSGLELDVVGSGKALDQSPAPGSHVASGTRITVKFGR